MTSASNLRKISAEEFCHLMSRDDFFDLFDAPVIIETHGKCDLVCMASNTYEEILDSIIQIEVDQEIDHWVYEFSMPEEDESLLKKILEEIGLTIEDIIKQALDDIKNTEGNTLLNLPKSNELFTMDFVRSYPVYVGETEEHALSRALSVEIEI